LLTVHTKEAIASSSMGANNEQRPKIVVLNAALIALTLVATGSRVWRRVFIMRNFELSDGESGKGYGNDYKLLILLQG
jgi:hypothetical protein